MSSPEQKAKMKKGREEAKAKKEAAALQHKEELTKKIKEAHPDFDQEKLNAEVEHVLKREELETSVQKCVDSLHKACTALDNHNGSGEKMISAAKIAQLIK